MRKDSVRERAGSSPAVAYFLVVFSIFFWGITFVCTKHLLLCFSAFEILFIRFVLAYGFLWILYPHRLKLSRRENVLLSLAGLTGVTLYQYTENLALNLTSASNVSIIVAISPIFTALTAQVFLKERHLGLRFLVGSALALFGVALVSLNGAGGLSVSPAGDLLALLSAGCWGFYSLFVTIINRRGHSVLAVTRKIFFHALVWMMPLLVLGVASSDPAAVSYVELSALANARRFSAPLNWLLLCFLGVLASGLCFVAWNKASTVLGTVRISAGLYLIPVVTILFAAVFLQERLTFMGILGSLLTILGLFISGGGTSGGMA